MKMLPNLNMKTTKFNDEYNKKHYIELNILLYIFNEYITTINTFLVSIKDKDVINSFNLRICEIKSLIKQYT